MEAPSLHGRPPQVAGRQRWKGGSGVERTSATPTSPQSETHARPRLSFSQFVVIRCVRCVGLVYFAANLKVRKQVEVGLNTIDPCLEVGNSCRDDVFVGRRLKRYFFGFSHVRPLANSLGYTACGGGSGDVDCCRHFTTLRFYRIFCCVGEALYGK